MRESRKRKLQKVMPRKRKRIPKVNMAKDFVAVVLAHGRPDNCPTFHSLRKHGYTGRIIVLVDNEDKTVDGYRKNFGKENVIVFNKKQISKRYRNADNFDNRKAVVYARNASFEEVKKLGYKYFVQLDDDYTAYRFRCTEEGEFATGFTVKDMDSVFSKLMDFYLSSGALSIAMAQTGDYIGGADSAYLKNGWTLRRKIMNSWFCDVDRPFPFTGRMNEDVSAYVTHGSRGAVFFTPLHVCLQQAPTQSAEGGMSEVYSSSGTYVKSFYTIMQHPSSVKVGVLGVTQQRIHHKIRWKNTVPKIISAEHKKK